MKLGTLLKTAGAVVILWSAAATAQTELTVHYAQPELWRVIHENIAAKFEEEYPGVKVVFPAPSPNYNEGIQLILRGAITNSNPDVSYQGLNHLRVIAARELAVPLTDFVANEKDWEARGYHQALMDLGTANGVVYGMAFGVSTPLIYYNGNLVRQAGGSINICPQHGRESSTLDAGSTRSEPTSWGSAFRFMMAAGTSKALSRRKAPPWQTPTRRKSRSVARQGCSGPRCCAGW